MATEATEATEAMEVEADAEEAIVPTTVSTDAITSCPGVSAAPHSPRAKQPASVVPTG